MVGFGGRSEIGEGGDRGGGGGGRSSPATRAKETGGWGPRFLFRRGPTPMDGMSRIHCALWNSYCHLLWDPVLWTGSPIYIVVALRPRSLQVKSSCFCHLPLLVQCFTETITAAAAAASKTAVPNTLEAEPVTYEYPLLFMNISIVVVIL
jgi:hypothetical protein